MSVAADAPPAGPPFRINMLWTDDRYRSGFIQVVTIMLVMLGAAWLVNNVIQNFADQDRNISFSFLAQPANYDINQRLIDYTSRDTNARAALVGILNTLLIALMGCITATVLGVIAGVLRLSKNWLIAKLMTVYVEMFRNVPLLIWILLIMAVVNKSLPSPRDLRGVDTGAVVATNRGLYVPAPVMGDGAWTVVIVFLLSVLAVIGLRIWAKRRQAATGAQTPVLWLGLAILAVPATLVYVVLGSPITLEYPALQGFNFRGGIWMRDSLIALWIALSLYTGAFIAEIVRAGILSVSHGQSEAAFALGLRPSRTMNLIILPQALRVIIPPLISQFLNLTKNSSLAIAVGYMDATGTLGGITLNQTGREMECILLLMGFYLIVSLTISTIMNIYNSRVKMVER